ncbi:MAG: hypothetical protein O3C17_10860 [Planctomycetota bacterium]|nr:hypothetical protein [Planctomycetota bacterium]
MQNSAWKLTALAGVIGLGFLIVLQAQKGMEPGDEPTAGAGGGEATSTAGEGGGESEKELLSQNGEPVSEPGDQETAEKTLTADTAPVPDFANRPVRSEVLPRMSPFAPEFTDFADRAGTGIATVSAEEAFTEEAPAEANPFATSLTDSAEETAPVFGSLSESGTATARVTSPPLFIDEAGEPEAGLVEPAPGAEVNPFATNPFATKSTATATATAAAPRLESLPQDSANEAKKRALELVAAARRAVDAGELDTGRELANAALELPVKYSPLDDRPETVLKEIDQLMKFRNLPVESAVAESPGSLPDSGEPQKEPGELILTSGQLEDKPFGSDPFQPIPETGTPSGPPLLGGDAELGGNDTELFPTEPANPFAIKESAAEPAIGAASEPLESLPFGATEAEPVRTTVRTEASGALVTNVTGDATIPPNGPLPALRPELTIEKVAPEEALLDQPMVYSVNVTNRGNATADQLVVEDHIPKGCKLIGTRPQAVMVGTKLIWRLGKLPAGESTSILVKVIPISEGEIGSVATVSFVTEVAARTEVRTAPKSPLTLTVETPAKASSGETVVLKFRVTNNSQQDALNVRLQDIIPAGLEHETGPDLTYDVGTIEAGRTFAADLELKAVKAGTFTNRATITADGGLKSEASSVIEIAGAAGLSLKSVPGKQVLVGQKAVHSVSVANASGTASTPGAIVTSRLPAEVQFLSATNNGRYDATSHSVKWQLPSVAAGANLTLQASLMAKTFGTHTTLTQLSGPGQPASKVESEISVRGIAALSINLDNVPATVLANDEFTVDATILNRGTGPDSNVQLSLILPEGFEFVTARGPVRLQRQPITLTATGQEPIVASAPIPEIGEKASVDFQITLRARKAGRPKIRMEVTSSQLGGPVATEAAIVVIDDAP